jgi:VWFA-related protein
MAVMHSRFGPRMAVLIGMTACAASGQQGGATFRATTRLVEVNVTALDAKGKPAIGLDKSDFEILDGGKRREIAFFRFDGEPAAPPSTAPLAANTWSNRNEPAAGRPWNVSALVLDSLNTPPQSAIWVRAQLMRYLQAMAPEARVAIFKMGGKLEVLHDFSSDADSLRERVKKSAIGMPLESIIPIDQLAVEFENILRDSGGSEELAGALERNLEMLMMANAAAQRGRLEMSLAAMEALGKHLARIPGRKNLVWVTAGFSMLSVTGAMGFGPRGSVESYETQVRDTSKRLAQDGVTLYIVDAGLLQPASIADVSVKQSSAPGGRGGRFQTQVDTADLSADPRSTMQTMASITGGRYLHNTNDMMSGFLEAANDLRGSYTLGFYSTDADEKWHSLKVRTKRAGVSLRHREGYIAESAPPQEVPDAWRKAALSGFGSSSIPLTAECRPEGAEVKVELVIDAHAMEFRKEDDAMVAQISIVFSDRTADGSSHDTTLQGSIRLAESEMPKALSQGVHYARQWKPESDVVQTRVVIRDKQSGKFGTLDLPVRKILEGLKTGG